VHFRHKLTANDTSKAVLDTLLNESNCPSASTICLR